MSPANVILQTEEFDHARGLAQVSYKTPWRSGNLPDQGRRGKDFFGLGLVRLGEHIDDLDAHRALQELPAHSLHCLDGPQRSLRASRDKQTEYDFLLGF